jgi:uncharacterized protein YjaZ
MTDGAEIPSVACNPATHSQRTSFKKQQRHTEKNLDITAPKYTYEHKSQFSLKQVKKGSFPINISEKKKIEISLTSKTESHIHSIRRSIVLYLLP